MPTRDRFDPRSFFGFTGQPLAVPNGNAPQAIEDRFKRHGQEAFLPYVDPFQTLARTQDYNRAGQALQIGEAENEFMGNLDVIQSNPSGLSDFLQKHPAATLSPMVRTWQRMQQPVRKDPYESIVAKEGSKYLKTYRELREAGHDASEAFSFARDAAKKDKEAGVAAKDDELFFVEKGGDLEDFGTLQQKGAGRAEMLDFIHKKGKPLASTEAKRLSDLQAEMDSAAALMDPQSEEAQKAHIDEKVEAFKTKYGREPVTAPEWQESYTILEGQKVGPKRKAYEDYITILEENGKRIPKAKAAAVPIVPVAPGAVPPVAAPAAVPIVPAVKPKAGMSPLSQVRSALKP
jgi:hypothetical protein